MIEWTFAKHANLAIMVLDLNQQDINNPMVAKALELHKP
jgi:hypothetical protein